MAHPYFSNDYPLSSCLHLHGKPSFLHMQSFSQSQHLTLLSPVHMMPPHNNSKKSILPSKTYRQCFPQDRNLLQLHPFSHEIPALLRLCICPPIVPSQRSPPFYFMAATKSTHWTTCFLMHIRVQPYKVIFLCSIFNQGQLVSYSIQTTSEDLAKLLKSSFMKVKNVM